MVALVELAKLSAAVYGDPSVNGWTLLMESEPNQDGYLGRAYQNATGEIVITNRGTRPTSGSDLLNDLMLTANISHPAQELAAKFAIAVALRYPDDPIVETGHSLGGNDAQAGTVALVNAGVTVSAVTFNAPGIGGYAYDKTKMYQVLNIYDQGDAIHLAGGDHLGTSQELPAGPNTAVLAFSSPIALLFGPVAIGALAAKALYNIVGPAHSIDTVVDFLSYGDGVRFGELNWSSAGLEGSAPLPPSTVETTTNGDQVHMSDSANNNITYNLSLDGSVNDISYIGANGDYVQYDKTKQSGSYKYTVSDGSTTSVVTFAVTSESTTWTITQANGRKDTDYIDATKRVQNTIFADGTTIESISYKNGPDIVTTTSNDHVVVTKITDEIGHKTTTASPTGDSGILELRYDGTIITTLHGSTESIETIHADGSIERTSSDANGVSAYSKKVDGTVSSSSSSIDGRSYSYASSIDGSSVERFYDNGVLFKTILTNPDGSYVAHLFQDLADQVTDEVDINGMVKSTWYEDGQPVNVTYHQGIPPVAPIFVPVQKPDLIVHGYDYTQTIKYNLNQTIKSSQFDYVDGRSSIETYNSIGDSAEYHDTNGNIRTYSDHSTYTKEVLENGAWITETTYSTLDYARTVMWVRPDGTHGDEIYRSNGTNSGTTYAADGSYFTYDDNGFGSHEQNYYTATGAIRSSVSQNGQLGSDVTDAVLLGDANLYVIGGENTNKIEGNAGYSTLVAGDHDTTLVAGSNATKMVGGSGDDTFYVKHNTDVVIEHAGGGTNQIFTTVNYYLPSYVQSLTATGSENIMLVGNDISHVLNGNDGDNTLVAGKGVATLVGGGGNNTYIINNSADIVIQQADIGIDNIRSTANYSLPNNVERLELDGFADLIATSNDVGGILIGNFGNSTLIGGSGIDVLEAESFNKSTLLALNGSSVILSPYDSEDSISVGSGNYFISGGSGDDTISLGGGKSLIAFGLDDGNDVILGANSSSSTISLGNGFYYGDLKLSKSGNDLILKASESDSITFREWYGTTDQSHEIKNLQLIEMGSDEYDPASSNILFNSAVVNFNFSKLVSAFELARGQVTEFSDWSLLNELPGALVSNSNTEAIGGDLAFYQGVRGGLQGVDYSAIVGILQDSAYGNQAQSIHTFESIATYQNSI
jgi:Ca2+-binding RTX toxin-like protein